jgi:ribosomal-protein-alanine N-acetyltransferase
VSPAPEPRTGAFRIERARPEDAAQVRGLARALLPGPGLPEGRVHVARGEAGVVGYLESRLVADELHVLALAVAPEARRRGAASALLAHALDDAAARGARVAHLELRASNAPALALYRGLGFAAVGRRTRYYADGEDAVLLSRHLEPDAARAARS